MLEIPPDGGQVGDGLGGLRLSVDDPDALERQAVVVLEPAPIVVPRDDLHRPCPSRVTLFPPSMTMVSGASSA